MKCDKNGPGVAPNSLILVFLHIHKKKKFQTAAFFAKGEMIVQKKKFTKSVCCVFPVFFCFLEKPNFLGAL